MKTLMLLLTSILLQAVNVNAATPWQSWPAVGDARLTWGPWVIYDSELRTPSGDYRPDSEDLALVIKYQRNIDKEDLLEATDEQWKHLGIPKAKRQQWLNRLAGIWPDVQKGDRLIFVVSSNGGIFFTGVTSKLEYCQTRRCRCHSYIFGFHLIPLIRIYDDSLLAKYKHGFF